MTALFAALWLHYPFQYQMHKRQHRHLRQGQPRPTGQQQENAHKLFALSNLSLDGHPTTGSKARTTYGHSLVVDPWGEVVLDAGVDAGVYAFDIEMDNVAKARQKVPSLLNARSFLAP